MKRRTAIKWAAPIVTAVMLPAHSQTTSEIPESTTPAPTTPTPTTTVQLNPCKDGEVPVCYDAGGGTFRTLCFTPEEAAKFIEDNPGRSYLGTCDNKWPDQ